MVLIEYIGISKKIITFHGDCRYDKDKVLILTNGFIITDFNKLSIKIVFRFPYSSKKVEIIAAIWHIDFQVQFNRFQTAFLGVPMQIHFTNHVDERLTGTLHSPANPAEYGIVMGHCFTCSRHTTILIQTAKKLSEAGFMVLRFDFSGNGQSEGEFSDSTYSKQIEEMKSAAAFLEERKVDKIGLVGHSMGSAAALLSAEKINGVMGICTLAATSDVLKPERFLDGNQREILDQSGEVDFVSRGRNLRITEKFFRDAGNYDILKTVSRLSLPLLIVHGDRDEIIPPESARKIREAGKNNTELFVLKNADHMFSDKDVQKKVSDKIKSWFLEKMN